MKKTLLLTWVIGSMLTVEAQTSVSKTSGFAKVPSSVANTAIKAEQSVCDAPKTKSSTSVPANTVKNKVRSKSSMPTETIIGATTFDLQTNYSSQNRILNHMDGTISATWITSASGDAAAADRGTGYSYFNGSSWNPATGRVETSRTGWPSITSVSGGEVIVAHGGLTFNKRPAKGTGAWTQSTLASVPNFWPRMVSGGANGTTLHLISNTNTVKKDGILPNITYSRSTDGGATWDITNAAITGIDSTIYNSIGGDNYAIDASGDNVAIVLGGQVNDLALFKSSDNGTTWTKTIIMDFPINAYNPATMITDTNNDSIAEIIDSNDGSVAVILDKNNKAHVFAGQMQIMDDDTAKTSTAFSYYPFTDGLLYWNENMGAVKPDTLIGVLDLNGNDTIDLAAGEDASTTPKYYMSMTSMPHAGIDAAGTIYLTYSSMYDGSDSQNKQHYRNIHVMKTTDNGLTWSKSLNVQNNASTEGVFPSMARRVDANVHLIYQRDEEPGLAVRGDEDKFEINDIVYVKVPVTEIIGINEAGENGAISSVQNYPNPFSRETNVSIHLVKSSDVSISVSTIMGQQVFETSQSKLAAGNHTVKLDASKLSPGVYFYTVKAGDQSVSRKMIVQ